MRREIFNPAGSQVERALRVIEMLDAFDDRSACARLGSAGFLDGDEASAEHAVRLASLRRAAEATRDAGHLVLPDDLSSNAGSLEEALMVLVSAMRDGVFYADAEPDWRRPFLDMLPQDGSFMTADVCKHDGARPAPEEFRTFSLSDRENVCVGGDGHWILFRGDVACGPGVHSTRFADPDFRGMGFGGYHCAIERMISLHTPKAQTSLTIGGYLSRSAAWDVMAKEASSLGLSVADKGPVPDFYRLESFLGEDELQWA